LYYIGYFAGPDYGRVSSSKTKTYPYIDMFIYVFITLRQAISFLGRKG
jgi:hypothetical protein